MLFRVYRDAFSGLPRVVWLLVLTGFINRCGTMVLPFLTLYLTARRGYSTAAAGAMLSLYGVGSVAGSLTGGWLCDRIDPDRVQVASLVGGGIGLIALGALSDPGRSPWRSWRPPLSPRPSAPPTPPPSPSPAHRPTAPASSACAA